MCAAILNSRPCVACLEMQEIIKTETEAQTKRILEGDGTVE